MRFKNDATINDISATPDFEQDVEYKVTHIPPPNERNRPGPAADPLVANTPPFDGQFYGIAQGQEQGPYPPPPGQQGPWNVEFSFGEWSDSREVSDPNALIVLLGAPGSFQILVV